MVINCSPHGVKLQSEQISAPLNAPVHFFDRQDHMEILTIMVDRVPFPLDKVPTALLRTAALGL